MFRRRALRTIFAAALFFSGFAAISSAQDRPVTTNYTPLRLSENFSPQESLQNFLTNTDRFVALRAEGAPISDRARALKAASESLDFAATPYGSSTSEQIARILMLREVLARTPLPALSAVPDRKEVQNQNLTHWDIPGTRLRMHLLESGPHQGEYRFDARTIERLDLTYRRVQALPRLKGEQDIYQAYLATAEHLGATEEAIATRLHGIRSLSPQDTLNAFLENMNAAYAIAIEAEQKLNAEPPQISLADALAAQDEAANNLLQAAAAFDLSDVPQIQRRDAGIEAALLLKEVLDRMLLPRIDAIPDAAQLASLAPDEAYRWRLPGTFIEIERKLSGPQTGNFLFDANTVASLRGSYAKLIDLPYRTQTTAADIAEFRSPEISPGFYEFYISSPGYLVPSTHALSRLVRNLPEWTQTIVSGQTLWQWTALALVLLVLVPLCWLLFWLSKRVASNPKRPVHAWFQVVPPLICAIWVAEAASFLDKDINFTGDELGYLFLASEVLQLLLLIWAIWRGFGAISCTILALPFLEGRTFDASLTRILCGLLAIGTGAAVLVIGLEDLGVDVVPLLAGLGVGGLAVALAIRPTLENLIGGLILFSDKPVRVGDFCTFGGMSGTIEDVGVRSTQIRASDRTLISIPNAKFVDMEIINWARCDKMLIQTVLGLRYETGDDQLRYVLVKIREMLHAHPMIDSTTIRVRFSDYGSSSLDVSLRIYALTRDWSQFYAIREDVFLRIKQIVEASGTGFAFPSQTLYMSQDEGLNEAQSDMAEQEVQKWRDAGNLPFPRLTPERTSELAGTLDYPPLGSMELAQEAAKQKERSEPLSKPAT